MASNKSIIGLTGGIASGKSAAAEMFAQAGAYIIDTDVISREVSESDEAKAELKKAFPTVFTENTLNRARLREIVFSSEDKRRELNGIMHPLILRNTMNIAKSSDAAINIVVAPLLIEAGFDKYVSSVITVSCDENMRIQRLMRRDNITKELAQSMVKAQLTDAEREAKSKYVISNNGTLYELRAQVIRVYCEISDSLGR